MINSAHCAAGGTRRQFGMAATIGSRGRRQSGCIGTAQCATLIAPYLRDPCYPCTLHAQPNWEQGAMDMNADPHATKWTRREALSLLGMGAAAAALSRAASAEPSFPEGAV